MNSHITIQFPKSTICLLDWKDIVKHVPQELLLEGFKKGKKAKRRQAMKTRMEKEAISCQ